MIPSSHRTASGPDADLSLAQADRPADSELIRLRADGADEQAMQDLCALPLEQRLRTAVACETRPGDVIVYATPTFHASFNGKQFRPLFQLMYWANDKTLRRHRRQEARAIRRNHEAMFNFPDETHYPYVNTDEWVGAAPSSERASLRREWAAWMRELAWVEEAPIVGQVEAQAAAEAEGATVSAVQGAKL